MVKNYFSIFLAIHYLQGHRSLHCHQIQVIDYIQMGKCYDHNFLASVDIDENGPLIIADKILS